MVPQSAAQVWQAWNSSGYADHEALVFRFHPYSVRSHASGHIRRPAARRRSAFRTPLPNQVWAPAPECTAWHLGAGPLARASPRGEEWAGFQDAVPSGTKVVAVRIRDEHSFKLFSRQTTPVLRGTAFISDPSRAYLWTKGWTPRLRTYPGMEVPNPLIVEICRGNADIETVLKDVLALTKLNYNTCRFGDGKPITLKFADAIGEVLITRPVKDAPPLPFMYYI